MMSLLHRVDQDIRMTPAGLPRQKIRSPKDQSAEHFTKNMSNTRSGTTNQSGLFAAKLFESYSVAIVNLGPFSLKRTLHQLPNTL